uniref:Uncharacterized protein n=1 Tax=Arundo donax TaxID=35708 RepID=A0A0A9G3Q9_ARUDO
MFAVPTAGRQSKAADVASDAPDPDHSAGGTVLPLHWGVLPPSPSSQQPLGFSSSRELHWDREPQPHSNRAASNASTAAEPVLRILSPNLEGVTSASDNCDVTERERLGEEGKSGCNVLLLKY